ncbi:hypothetical protein [Rubricoccus marinus]|nr:hypothetical protein [Rubricoccus marinus]
MLRPLASLFLLAAVIAPEAIAQKPQTRPRVQIQSRPQVQITPQVRVNNLPAVSRATLRRVTVPLGAPDRMTSPAARLDNAMRAAILTEGTASEPSPRAVLTELELTAQRPYSDLGRVNFHGASVVETSITTYDNGSSTGNYALFPPKTDRYTPRLEVELELESRTRYLLDFRIDVGGGSRGGTLKLSGAGLNSLHPFEAGAHHLLAVVEAPWSGMTTLYLSSEDQQFYFDGLEVSRIE